MKNQKTGTSSNKLTLKGVAAEVRKPAFFLLGMFAAGQLGKLVDKRLTPTVSGLLGLDGETSKYIKPLLLTGSGLVVSTLAKNQDIKMVGYGVASVGGIVLAKNILNVDILSLSGTDEEYPRTALPGFGNPNLPELEVGVPPVEGIDFPEVSERPID